MTGPTTYIIELTREVREAKFTDWGWGLEGLGPSSLCAGRGGKDDSNVAPFRMIRLASFIRLLSNIMSSKNFLSHLILTISWIRSQWEKLTPSFHAFFCVAQITILATARITRNTICFSPLYRGSTWFTYPVGWSCRIRWRLLCRWVRPPPTGVLDMTLNNLMAWFQ